MPGSGGLPYQWYDTPNVHLCTIGDFDQFCANHGVHVMERAVLTGGRPVAVAPNLLGALAVYRFDRSA
jgi:methionine biosynthesis protein MetW